MGFEDVPGGPSWTGTGLSRDQAIPTRAGTDQVAQRVRRSGDGIAQRFP